jgi:hypothetical protein
MTETERLAHYRELAAQFREWAKTETNEEARAGLLDMARQYERLACGSSVQTYRPGGEAALNRASGAAVIDPTL